jgi:hypothetical protein
MSIMPGSLINSSCARSPLDAEQLAEASAAKTKRDRENALRRDLIGFDTLYL